VSQTFGKNPESRRREDAGEGSIAVQVSISPTSYEELFVQSVLLNFSLLRVWICNFWQKNIGTNNFFLRKCFLQLFSLITILFCYFLL